MSFGSKRKADAYKNKGVPVMQGRHRRCASQQGYALFFLIKLGLENARLDHLGGATPSLALARRRLELRQGTERRDIELHPQPFTA